MVRSQLGIQSEPTSTSSSDEGTLSRLPQVSRNTRTAPYFITSFQARTRFTAQAGRGIYIDHTQLRADGDVGETATAAETGRRDDGSHPVCMSAHRLGKRSPSPSAHWRPAAPETFEGTGSKQRFAMARRVRCATASVHRVLASTPHAQVDALVDAGCGALTHSACLQVGVARLPDNQCGHAHLARRACSPPPTSTRAASGLRHFRRCAYITAGRSRTATTRGVVAR